MQGLEELLAKKEAVAAVAKRKKEDREASKEQRKIAKLQQQKEKEERAAERAQKREEKLRQQNARALTGRSRRGGAVGGDVRGGGVPSGSNGWAYAGNLPPHAGGASAAGGGTRRQHQPALHHGLPPEMNTARFAVEEGPWGSSDVPTGAFPAFTAPRLPPNLPRAALSESPVDSLGFGESPPRSQTPVVHSVPRRWGRPPAAPASPHPPPPPHHDSSQNLSYLQLIQGLQTGFYNPHPNTAFQQASTSAAAWGSNAISTTST